MISGEKREVLKDFTDKSILAFISDYDIFRYYMPEKNWELNRACNSPFRKETNPSFSIYTKDGRVMFIDFSDSKYRGDCFQFVQFLYNIDYNKALEMIDKDFNLGIKTRKNDSEKDYKIIVSEYSQPENLEKRYSHIQVITRKFNNDELFYWNNYYQDIQDLRDNNVYPVKKIFLNRRLVSFKSTDLVFGYLYDGCWKIYKPFAPKHDKWFPNNVPITTMDGKQNLSKDMPVIINKSKKDYMVMKKIYPHVCSVQNESWACFSEENVEFIKSNSSRQVLSFDSDEPGVKNSKIVTEMFDFEYCNVPNYYLKENIKDWADLSRIYGLNLIEHYLKQKFIIP
jgi:hypothetical protein